MQSYPYNLAQSCKGSLQLTKLLYLQTPVQRNTAIEEQCLQGCEGSWNTIEASNRESRAGSRSSRLPCIVSRLHDDVILLMMTQGHHGSTDFLRMIEAAWRTEML